MAEETVLMMKSVCRLLILTVAGLALFSCTVAKRPKTDDAAVKPEAKADIQKAAAARQKTPPSPAIGRLMKRAASEMAAGNYDSALVAAERALRLNPSDAAIWSRMAEIRLRLGDFGQAEQLAEKSNLMAKTDDALRAKNWRIISEALRAGGEIEKAEKAAEMAEKIEAESR